MCGIIGYIGPKKTVDVLLNGLRKLEYRGYDSAGMFICNSKKNQLIKSVGKIKSLEEKLNSINLIDSSIGIAHTRWATTGKVSIENSHPHKVGNVSIVHNGIIENYEELKNQLVSEGYSFYGDTDTEVVCTLLDKYSSLGEVNAINKVCALLVGSYALGIIFDTDKEHLYAVRKDSPLIVGIGVKENFIVSDILAISDYTNKYFLLEEGEVAVLGKESVEVFAGKEKVFKEIRILDKTEIDNGKNGYRYFMEKEIMEEPVVLEKMIKPYLEDITKLPDISKYEEIHIVACGSAMYAGMIGKILLEDYTNTKAIVDVASEYRYKNNIYDRKTLVVLISQSGETADTIAAMRNAKEKGVDTLAIVNVETSTIYREADMKILTTAGREVAVATTKAYILQVLVLGLLAVKQGLDKGIIKSDDKVFSDMRILPKLVKDILDKDKVYLRYAEKLKNKNDAFFIGRKIDYAVSLEGSLKLKEISYIHSEAYQAGELKHGTISLIDEGTVVFGIVTDRDICLKSISNIKEVEARGANTIIVTTNGLAGEFDNENMLVVPEVSRFLQPILIVPVLQLIAFHTSILKGCDVDQPKNLAKSVTVE